MSAPEMIHTVAVHLRGTRLRVLVEHLVGTAEAAELAAKEVVWNFAAHAPRDWTVEVVTSQPITDIDANGDETT